MNTRKEVFEKFALTHDVLRHTFISMFVAKFRSMGEAALQAWELHHTPEAARVGFLAGVARGDFDVALQWLQRTGGGQDNETMGQ